MKPILLALVLALVVTGCSTGSKSPEAIALKYYDNSSDHEWDTTVTLVDAKNLQEFQQEMNSTLVFLDSLEAQVPGFIEADSVLSLLQGVHRHQSTPQEFFVAFMNILIPRNLPSVKPTFIPLGEVKEGSDTVHVISKVRLAGEPDKTNRLLILTNVQSPDGWKVLLPPEITTNAKNRVNRLVKMIEMAILRKAAKKVK